MLYATFKTQELTFCGKMLEIGETVCYTMLG